ncbi:MAG TPA: TonB-dependent receptor, partial [Porphyromonadaceae bacterium]|nr:TonB-dependent receptor [Porphyromonadaceae bacterium]
MKRHLKRYFNSKPVMISDLVKTAFILLLALCSGVIYADNGIREITQRKTITGVVSEADGETLPGVSVSIKGTTQGTITNADGEYTLPAESSSVLVFTYMGKKPVEIAVGNRNIVSVVMEDDTHLLEEVVVYTGYMTQKKADLTGSLSIASASDIEKNPSANAMKSLQGKLSGVHITTNGGNPSENVGIQIRGVTSLAGAIQPLIVLDGMPTQNLNLRDINSNDIESIQV